MSEREFEVEDEKENEKITITFLAQMCIRASKCILFEKSSSAYGSDTREKNCSKEKRIY